ncbi:hypothetical protein D3C71_1752100 [compost metagenome]
MNVAKLSWLHIDSQRHASCLGKSAAMKTPQEHFRQGGAFGVIPVHIHDGFRSIIVEFHLLL